ncbi:hypothetical protein ACFY1U_10890 [Streptomyces sp. NPDC001351]|uniref:hypothetical protein n=1 Tax=Streptomyces sp. NPDC001351 TaxID=3364564 RepID=UPI00367681C7
MRAAHLRPAAALAEVEGLCAALLRASSSRRRRRLRAELAHAAGRLAALAAGAAWINRYQGGKS